MFSTKARALVRQQWAGLIALFLALTGGVAWASHPGGANTINSADIINGEVKNNDLAPDSVGGGKIMDGQIKNADINAGAVKSNSIGDNEVKDAEIATGAVRTDEIQNGQVQTEDLADEASGARAWGLMDADGNLLRSKNVSAAFNLAGGTYCINPGPGIDPDTAVMVVGEDSTTNSTSDALEDVSQAEWNSTPLDCPEETMEVLTWNGNGSAGTLGATDVGGFDVRLANQGFTFVIP